MNLRLMAADDATGRVYPVIGAEMSSVAYCGRTLEAVAKEDFRCAERPVRLKYC